MTPRDRQRTYNDAQLDRLFPGLWKQYERRCGERYFAPTRDARQLGQSFGESCACYDLATQLTRLKAATVRGT